MLISSRGSDERAVQHTVGHVLPRSGHLRRVQQRETSYPGQQQPYALYEAD